MAAKSFDFYHSKIITAIASFDSQGHFMPLYLGIDGERYKVYSAWEKPAFNGYLTFHCEIIDGDYKKPVIATYHKTEDVWTIATHGY